MERTPMVMLSVLFCCTESKERNKTKQNNFQGIGRNLLDLSKYPNEYDIQQIYKLLISFLIPNAVSKLPVLEEKTIYPPKQHELNSFWSQDTSLKKEDNLISHFHSINCVFFQAMVKVTLCSRRFPEKRSLG